MEINLISKKKSGKQNLIWPSDSNNSKMILTLLAEIITFYIGPITIDVSGLDLEFILG